MPAYKADAFAPPAPVANVILRDPVTGKTLSNVLMLIDSGADITMLPEAPIRELAAKVEAGESYETTTIFTTWAAPPTRMA